MLQQTVIYQPHELLLNSKKEQTFDTYSNLEEPQVNYVQWRKASPKRLYTLCFHLYSICERKHFTNAGHVSCQRLGMGLGVWRAGLCGHKRVTWASVGTKWLSWRWWCTHKPTQVISCVKLHTRTSKTEEIWIKSVVFQHQSPGYDVVLYFCKIHCRKVGKIYAGSLCSISYYYVWIYNYLSKICNKILDLYQLSVRSSMIYFFIYILIGGKLLYNAVVVSALQQCKPCTIIYVPSPVSLPPLPASHPSKSSQSARLGSLCYTAVSHQPSRWWCSFKFKTISYCRNRKWYILIFYKETDSNHNKQQK